MSILKDNDKKIIKDFISNNPFSQHPLIDLRTHNNVITNLNNFINNTHDFIVFGSSGHYRSNAFCKIDNVIYILTYYFDDLIEYSYCDDKFIQSLPKKI